MKDISIEVFDAIAFLKKHESFNSMNLSARGGIAISDEAVEALKKAGFRICWADTFKGGCWMVYR